MFGTGKDVDTGETYLTAFGKKIGETYDDMSAIFKTLDSRFNRGEMSGINGKGGILGSYLLGNNNLNYRFSSNFENDINAIYAVIKKVTDGGVELNTAINSVKKSISTSVEFDDFIKKIDLTGKSFDQAASIYIPAFIKQLTSAVTITTVLKGVLSGFVSIIGNLVVTAVASLAMGALVKAGEKVGEVFHNIKDNTFGKSFEEQKQQIDEMGQALDNSASSIDS